MDLTKYQHWNHSWLIYGRILLAFTVLVIITTSLYRNAGNLEFDYSGTNRSVNATKIVYSEAYPHYNNIYNKEVKTVNNGIPFVIAPMPRLLYKVYKRDVHRKPFIKSTTDLMPDLAAIQKDNYFLSVKFNKYFLNDLTAKKTPVAKFVVSRHRRHTSKRVKNSTHGMNPIIVNNQQKYKNNTKKYRKMETITRTVNENNTDKTVAIPKNHTKLLLDVEGSLHVNATKQRTNRNIINFYNSGTTEDQYDAELSDFIHYDNISERKHRQKKDQLIIREDDSALVVRKYTCGPCQVIPGFLSRPTPPTRRPRLRGMFSFTNIIFNIVVFLL